MKYLDLTGLREVWANIKSYISSKIPTKTSQLQNDSNYVTTSQLPSKTSQLTNDSDFTTNAKLATKQDTINDLAAIRSGASKGATAVQPSELASKANDSDVVHKSGDETIAGNKTFSNKIKGNLQGNADTATSATKSSCLDNYNAPGSNKIYLDWDTQKKGYVGLKVDNTVMGGLITTDNLGSQNVVHKSGEEHINGVKHFYNTIYGYGGVNILNNSMDINTTPTSTSYSNIHFMDKNYKTISYIQYAHNYNGIPSLSFFITDSANKLYGVSINSAKEFLPYGDNTYSLGKSNMRWANVYATTFNGNLKGNADTSTKASCLDNYSSPNANKIYLDWDQQVKGYIGLKVDNTVMGGLITTDNLGSQNVVDRTSNQSINGEKTFNNVIQAQDSLIVQNADSNAYTRILQGWIELSQPGHSGIDFKHAGNQDYLGRIALNPDNILYLETINGAPIMANGQNIVRSVNGVNADSNGNVNISGFSNGIGEIIQGYYVPNGIVQKSGSVYFGTLVQPDPGATLNDFRDINITITNEFYPETGKVYDYSQIFSTLYLHSYDSEYAVDTSFYCGSNPKVDKWFGGWVKVAGRNLVRNSGKYLCTSVSPYGYAVTLRYNLTMACEISSYPGGSYPEYSCKIVSKSVPQNQMTVTAKATFMRVG